MFWQKTASGYALAIRLTPKASRDCVLGSELLSDGREVLKVHVRAVPEDGKANAALIKLIGQKLGLPKSALSLDKGATSRLKRVEISAKADIEPKLIALGLGSS